MSLITDPKYSKTIDIDQCNKESQVDYSFYATSTEYGPNIDNITQISRDFVKIFDS